VVGLRKTSYKGMSRKGVRLKKQGAHTDNVAHRGRAEKGPKESAGRAFTIRVQTEGPAYERGTSQRLGDGAAHEFLARKLVTKSFRIS